MPSRPPSPVSHWRNRVTELRYLSPRELDDHPLQHKIHPDQQRSVMRGILQEIGIADVLLAYVSPTTGRLTAIDGHLRKSLEDTPWPTVILDVDDAEAAYILAAGDEVTLLAQKDREALDRLLREVQSGDTAVQQMLSEMAQNAGLYPDALPSLDDLGEQYGEPDETAFWKTISLKVPPDVYQRFLALMTSMDGESEADRFVALLDQAEA